jgi:thiamine biosynthesis lipoprotein
VEVGGEIRVRGRKQPAGKKMEIGIESPADFESDELILRKVIRPDQGAVTTSGNFHKYYESRGQIITHLIDPRTGYSISNELISVTVFAPRAMIADGYDHALMGMGLQEGLNFAEQHPDLEAYFIYKRQDGIIADTATAGFYDLMK